MGEITVLLARAGGGDSHATDDLIPLVYDELRRLAASHLAREREGHTLQPTALANEAYMRLVEPGGAWQNRAHFFGAAAIAIRRILTDHARARQSEKRGGGASRVELDQVDVAAPASAVDVLDLDEALKRLHALDPVKARLVELRFFGGMTEEDAASLLGISRSTAARDWQFARVWLRRELSQGDPS